MLDRAGETGKDEVLEMKRVEKLYMIEITEIDAGKYWSIIYGNEKLSDEQLKAYDLDYLGCINMRSYID